MCPFSEQSKPGAYLTYETICPACFEKYGPGEIVTAYPVCPDCSSEAMDIEVKNFKEFMASSTVLELDALLTRWEQAEGFRPEYKKAKAARIRSIRDQKASQN